MLTEGLFAQMVKDAGGTAYRVGGSIRNQILGMPVHDDDYCVTGLTPERFEELFPRAYSVGLSFHVYLIEIDSEICEVAFARREVKRGEGHRGFEIDSSPDITIEEDLGRRDFTMNAMAYDIIGQKLIDPFNGRQDIHSGLIHATSDAFKEDPLRVYRAARFAAQLGFTVGYDTVMMMQDVALQEDMKTLSVERVYLELERALESDHPELFFEVLKNGQCLQVHFKEVHDLIGVEQHPDHHPEGDAYNHTMLVLHEMCVQTKKVERRFAALCHDFGKARTPREEWPKHHGHDILGVGPLEELSVRLKLPTKWFQAAHFGCVNHMRFHLVHQMRDVKKVDMIEAARRSPLGVEGFAQLGMADARGRAGVYDTHSNYEPFLQWAGLIAVVRGKKELQGLKAKDDKRKRQAALIKETRTNGHSSSGESTH